jgi:hypothetical protein
MYLKKCISFLVVILITSHTAPASVKFSALNKNRNLRAASSLFKLKYRPYDAKLLSFDVPAHLQESIALVKSTVSMDV